jgi:hypothetical protein
MIKLKDGSKVKDVRLGRLIQFDKQSRKYGIMEVVKDKKPRSYTWRCNTLLDQGKEGSCVGHGIAHELLALPTEVDPTIVNHKYAREVIYWGAQQIDDWPGGAYPNANPFYEGTTILAGVKFTQKLGWFDNYRWSFGLDELILGIGYNGPAVLGLAWKEGMMDTDDKGYIHAKGEVQGGHCILCRGVDIKKEEFLLPNSWGRDWGLNGECKISFPDMSKLLKLDGEACFFIKRHKKNK